jgi:hypothetical protein
MLMKYPWNGFSGVVKLIFSEVVDGILWKWVKMLMKRP